MADEALKCLTSLLEGVPGWIADLENILQQSTARQKEILFENQPAEDEQPPVDSAQDGQERPRRPSTSSSVRSTRSKDRIKFDKPADGHATPVRNQLPHMTHEDEMRLAQRKRKTMSACSGRETGPLKYRSRSMVVVYYDGETQKPFEEVVRAIGTCRNSLRKGKMNAKMAVLARVDAGSGSDSNNEDSIVRYRSAKPRQRDGSDAFDKVDGFLEKAQSMCERAAHQVLRDGDCALEIKHAHQHFVDAQKVGEAELPTWQAAVEKGAQMKRKSEDEESEGEEAPPQYSSSEKRIAATDPSPNPFAPTDTLEVDLEADDEDDHSDGDKDEEFALNAVRMGRPYSQRPYMRSSRLAAH